MARKPQKEDVQDSKRPGGKENSLFVYRDYTVANYIPKTASVKTLVIVQ